MCVCVCDYTLMSDDKASQGQVSDDKVSDVCAQFQVYASTYL